MVFVTVALIASWTGKAQAPTAKNIDDSWQGTLHLQQRDLRIVLKVSHGADGALAGTMYSIDQGGQGMNASSISFADGTLKVAIQMLDMTYEGKLSADGKSITGTFTQGSQPMQLVLERSTPETAWTIPEAPKPIPPMPADAKPVFEVLTIKPSPPDEQGKLFGVRGGGFVTINTTLMDLIKFAYGVQDKQVTNLPDWASSQKYDLNGKPDVPGTPNPDQLRNMVRQSLADRFQLKLHEDKKDMSAYMLSIAEGGEKMEKAPPDAGALPGLFFRGLGVLTVRNATMQDFCELMQSAVLDRPVVDETELQGRYNFLLKWTPDESQFGGMGIKVPPPSDAADAPPPLYTAISEQIGLKLSAGKGPVRVLVIDHVDHPSAN
ncbi:MAG TPA: TIGR03435 family protein [Acidobacteriaceae bacterium]|nr:TIGR03435 family protein [Acidobacteriaceae bacterium]